MHTIITRRFPFAVLALAAGAAWAQSEPEDIVVAQAAPIVGDTLGFAAGELGQERVVKGAPYCADAVHETVQWLPDAAGGAPNRIVHQQSTRLCRDGEGRTRQEVDRQGRKLVYLRDPVARDSWLLDPAAKTARRLGSTVHAGVLSFDSAAWREYTERLREWGRDFGQRWAATAPTAPTAPTPPTPPMPPTPPTPAVVAKGEREMHVIRIDPGSVPVPPAPLAELAPFAHAVPPAVSWRASGFAPRGAGVLSPLGSKDIEGVRANGERTTWTIEAGKVGNEKPIVIVREVWTAPDLMLTLSSRDFDPRSAETNYRLQNLKRGEPDAVLMRVPADYTQRPSAKASGATG